jgi:hypothetical protein
MDRIDAMTVFVAAFDDRGLAGANPQDRTIARCDKQCYRVS